MDTENHWHVYISKIWDVKAITIKLCEIRVTW